MKTLEDIEKSQDRGLEDTDTDEGKDGGTDGEKNDNLDSKKRKIDESYSLEGEEVLQNAPKRRSRRLTREAPEFEPKDLKKSSLQLTMKEEQEKLMEKFNKKRKDNNDKQTTKFVHNGNLKKLKTFYVNQRTTKNMSFGKWGGFVTLPYKKHCGNKRSCVQDAFANVSVLFGFEFRDTIYKYFTPNEYNDTDIMRVIRHPIIKTRFYVKNIFQFGIKDGLEHWFYTKIMPLGGKYIIKCRVENNLNKRRENHVFVINADFKEEKNDVVAALIDNQARSQLTGIQKSDLKDKYSMRRICSKLYGGKTFFDRIWHIQLKENHENVEEK